MINPIFLAIKKVFSINSEDVLAKILVNKNMLKLLEKQKIKLKNKI